MCRNYTLVGKVGNPRDESMSSNVICRAIKKKSWRKITRGGLLPPANEVCEGYVFTGVCLSTRGPCLDAQGGGRAWLLPGRECLVAPRRGHALLLRGHAWLLHGACVVAQGEGSVHGCCWGGMLGI